MPSPRAELLRRSSAVRCLLSATLLALAPKCLACLWAYAGLGAALGFGGRELCGAPTSSPAAWLTSFALAAAALALCGFLVVRRRP